MWDKITIHSWNWPNSKNSLPFVRWPFIHKISLTIPKIPLIHKMTIYSQKTHNNSKVCFLEDKISMPFWNLFGNLNKTHLYKDKGESFSLKNDVKEAQTSRIDMLQMGSYGFGENACVCVVSTSMKQVTWHAVYVIVPEVMSHMSWIL